MKPTASPQTKGADMRFVFINNINGICNSGGHDHVVHAADCKDHEIANAPVYAKYVIEAATLQDAEAAFRSTFYSDFDEETQWEFSSDIKPCARR
jgi:hypothetical protein